ncbi:hypothetical protein Tco_1284073 [Tanacetum coccineum]
MASGQSGTLVGQGSAVIVVADVDHLPQSLDNPLESSGSIPIKSVLNQKTLDAFCRKFHILECVHPELPGRNPTIHESPVGKIGVYTRFFEYANFRLPLSLFLIDILRHFRIKLSQLSVIGAAKFSHFKILCRVSGIEPTVDAFACPVSFSWNTNKSVRKDPCPKSTEYNAGDCDILSAHQAPFKKFLESFLCLVGLSRNYDLDKDTYPTFLHDDDEEMDLFAFINHVDPTKVRVGERKLREGEERLLDSTVGRTVLLLLVAPARAEGELTASVEKLFDEGGSSEQGNTAEGGGHDADIQPIIDTGDADVEVVVAKKPKDKRIKRQVIGDVSGSNHPPKRLREDHSTVSGATTGEKYFAALQGLLENSMLNAEVGVASIPIVLFVTYSVTPMPKHKGGDHTDSITRPNLRTTGPSARFVISSDSSHHSSTNAAEVEVDSFIRSFVPLIITSAVAVTNVVSASSVLIPETMAKVVPQTQPSMFNDSASIGTSGADVAGASHPAGK